MVNAAIDGCASMTTRKTATQRCNLGRSRPWSHR
jgi:hypothetical protein